MQKQVLILASAVVLACSAMAPVALGSAPVAQTSSFTGPTVIVTIKTLTKTLLAPKAVRGRTGWITKGGTPKGKCSADSAAGALDVATHGHWAGKYYASVPGIFVTSILGVKPKGSDYWGVFINNKVSSLGICAIKLHAHEHLRFSIVK